MAGTTAGLSAGTAGANLTPDRMLYLEGYGNRDKPATGTRDPLEARAIVFGDGRSRAALVAADLCGMPADSVQRIRSAATAGSGIPGESIIVTYSHTHSSPAVTSFAGVTIDEEYVAWMEAAVAGAVVAASQELRPVRLGAGEGRADFNVNRRRRTPQGTVMGPNPLGMVDKRVRVLRVDPADAPTPIGTLGERFMPQSDPLALLFSYVCHPTVLGGASYRYSGDYPGVARQFTERVYAPEGGGAGTHALYLPGCFGNVRPHLLRPDGRWREGTDHELTVFGRLLGSEVVQVAEGIVGEPVADLAVGRRGVRLAYARVPDEAELRSAQTGPRRWWAQGMLDRLAREGSLPEAETSEVQVLRLGRHWLVALPGETMLEIGLSIERGLVELGLADPARGDLTLTIGYANDYVGYLCTASAFGEGGYEPATAYPDYLRPGPFAPEVEAALVGTALGLALELGSGTA
jgi:neutral ceramidase